MDKCVAVPHVWVRMPSSHAFFLSTPTGVQPTLSAPPAGEERRHSLPSQDQTWNTLRLPGTAVPGAELGLQPSLPSICVAVVARP